MLKKIISIGLLFFSSYLIASEEVKMLNEKQQNIILISAFTANGDLDKLKVAFIDALDANLTINEIKKADKNDELGREASPTPNNFDRDAYGGKIRAMLAGLEKDISGTPWQNFSPIVDKYLKEHLFADIFVRDILDYKTRELVTISALAVMKGTEGQLKFHLSGAMNVGISREELKNFIKVIDEKINSKQAKVANKVFKDVLKSRY